MPTFQEALTWTLDDHGCLRGAIEDDWRQGRAAYGGLLGALALKAMQGRVSADRPARSLQVVFVAPLGEGELRVEPELLREGRSTSLCQARIFQGETLLLTASAAFGADRPSDIVVQPPAPDSIPAPEDCMALPFLPGVTPNFTQHFEYRWAQGGFPFSGAKEPGFKGWCRHKAPAEDPAQALVALADSWPAPTLPMARGPVPASTVTWNLQLLHLPEPGAAQGWWRMDYDADHAQGGVHTITGRLHAPDGQLAAISTQLAVVFDKR